MGTFIYGRDVTKMKETEKMLLRAEKLSVIGELAAGIAHEIPKSANVYTGIYSIITFRRARSNPLIII